VDELRVEGDQRHREQRDIGAPKQKPRGRTCQGDHKRAKQHAHLARNPQREHRTTRRAHVAGGCRWAGRHVESAPQVRVLFVNLGKVAPIKRVHRGACQGVKQRRLEGLVTRRVIEIGQPAVVGVPARGQKMRVLVDALERWEGDVVDGAQR
jgi:hypothetical protein